MPRNVAISLIRLYQATLSPDHGPRKIFYPTGYCRFHPTCSQYSLEAIERYGVLKGGLLALKRLAKCHPLRSLTYDPLT